MTTTTRRNLSSFFYISQFIFNVTTMVLIILTLNFGLTWDTNIDLFSNFSNACIFVSAFTVGLFCYRSFNEMSFVYCMSIGMLLGGLVGLLLFFSVRFIFPVIADSPHWIPFAAGIGVAWSLFIVGLFQLTREEWFQIMLVELGIQTEEAQKKKKGRRHNNNDDEDEDRGSRKRVTFAPTPEIYLRRPDV